MRQGQLELARLFGLDADSAFVRLRPRLDSRISEPAEILLDNQLWFASVRSQDDVFEGAPRMSWRALPTSEEEVRELIRRKGISADLAEDIFQSMMTRMRDPELLQAMQADLAARFAGLYANSSIASFFCDGFKQQYWASYANRGDGYGIVFDFSHPWTYQSAIGMGPMENVPFPVTYVEESSRPTIELAIAPADHERSFEDIEKALLTKSDAWSHQDEHRLFRVGINAGYVAFPEESIKAVLLGYQLNGDDAERIIRVVAQRNVRVPVLQMQVNPESYRLRGVVVDY